jgi:flagellar biosynthesis/type III secretory pathway M-ring protein FliF/YscJ
MIGAGAGLLVLLLLLFVMAKRGKKKRALVALQKATEIAAGHSKGALETGDSSGKQMEAQIAEQIATKKQQEADALKALKLPQVTTKKAEVLVKHIAEEAKKDATSMVQVLRNWMNEAEK